MSTSQATVDLHEAIAEILPKSQHNKVDRLVELFHPDTVNHVEIPRTHVPVDTVEIYGLVIEVDANGYAAAVHFPAGAEVIA